MRKGIPAETKCLYFEILGWAAPTKIGIPNMLILVLFGKCEQLADCHPIPICPRRVRMKTGWSAI